MKRIFIGMIVVFIDFNLNFENNTIGLIPDFIGYFMMIEGLKEITNYSNNFTKVLPYVKSMAIATALTYLMDFFGIRIYLLVSLLLGLVLMAVCMYISYTIIMGIKDVETEFQQNLNTESLYSAWKISMILSFVTYVLIIVPGLMILCSLATLVAYVYYLVQFNKTQKLFYEHTQKVI